MRNALLSISLSGCFLLATDLLACARTGPPCRTVPCLRTIGPSSRGALGTCGGKLFPTLALVCAGMAEMAASRAAERAYRQCARAAMGLPVRSLFVTTTVMRRMGDT